jgi:hypothetical protein
VGQGQGPSCGVSRRYAEVRIVGPAQAPSCGSGFGLVGQGPRILMLCLQLVARVVQTKIWFAGFRLDMTGMHYCDNTCHVL